MTGAPDAVRFSPDVLREFACRALAAAGASDQAAGLCAEVLVDADLSGVETHGVARLPQYVDTLVNDRVDGNARPEVSAATAAVLTVHGRNGLGPVNLTFATDLAVSTAREHGVAVVTVHGSNHAGAMGWYVQRAVEAGTLAVIMTGSTKPMVAPPTGAAPYIGTNAVAYGAPAGAADLMFDASTSAASRSRLEAFCRAGLPLPEGWAVDPAGRPALDAAEVIEGIDGQSGHSLLPFGGPDGRHKGFGIGLLVELLCGPVAGARWGQHTLGTRTGVGHFVLCLELGAFGAPAAEIEKRVEALGTEIRAVPAGLGQAVVRIPGDRRRSCAAQRARDGIPVPLNVLAELDHTAAQLGIARPEAM